MQSGLLTIDSHPMSPLCLTVFLAATCLASAFDFGLENEYLWLTILVDVTP